MILHGLANPKPKEFYRSQIEAKHSLQGIRFYKDPQNTGVHNGSLWTANGTRVASGTFSGETASGWQQLNFAIPVSILANTTYIASYDATHVHSYDSSYFTAQGADRPPLHALKSGVDGPNGVYIAANGSFPINTLSDQNYWVDVVFTTGSGGQGTSNISVAPASGSGA